nr:PQQ-like beta-propeller repeat protein [Planctomycetota bacterium]
MTRPVALPLSHSHPGSAAGCMRRMLLTGVAILLHDVAAQGQPSQGVDARPTAQLYSARADHLALERARQSFEAGRTIEGVSFLQQVLDGTSDSFVTTADGVSGARLAVRSVLGELPTVSRRLYESQQTTAAAAAFNKACERQDVDALREVTRRYPSTDPGFRAVDRLAAIAFDRGDFGAAARLWNELLDDPVNSHRVTPALVARAIVALRRTGQDGQASELAVRYSEATVRAAGKTATLSSLMGGIDHWSPPIATTGRAGTAAPGLTPPAFPPVWQHSAQQSSSALDELWSGNRRGEARPLATPTGAVFLKGQVVVRNPSGLTAFDAAAGNIIWNAPLPGVAALAASDTSGVRDLHDLSRFEENYGGNGVLGSLSTDGRHLYVIDRIPVRPRETRTASRSPVPVYDQPSDGDRANLLIALPLPESEIADLHPVWTAGAASGADASDPLAGHFFFGPPVVSDGRLLVVTEKQQRLNLISLDPATGRLVWQQPLGFVPRPVAGEPMRASAPCQPAVIDGIAVCGSNAGFAVAVDVATGRLLWAYDYSSTETAATGSAEWTSERSVNHGDAAVVAPIVARGESVVLLPCDSQRVHCVDLKTGRTRWTAPREEGLYVACVTERAAVVAGRSHCRSLSIVSGSLLWSVRLGAPAGTGVVTDTMFLAPLQTGVIAAIELATGRRVGFDTPRRNGDFQPVGNGSSDVTALQWRPGNLFTHGGSIYSVGAFEVARLETAESVFARTSPEAKRDLLETARIELASGALDHAQTKLETVVSAAASGPQQHEAKRLLRELHYLRLPQQAESEASATLAELDRLSETPDCRGRFLLEAVEHELSFDDSVAARRRVQELSQLQLTEPLAAPHEATHLVTVAGWMPAVLRRLDQRSLAPNQPLSSLPLLSDGELRRLLLCRPDDSSSAQLRLELARRAVADGDFHRAELLLLRAGRDGITAEEANGELALLRHRCGVAVSACGMPIDERHINEVRVTGKLWSAADDGLCKAFGRSRRGFQTRFLEPLRVVDRGDSRRARLAIVDLNDGVCRGEFAVDARLRFPSVNRQPLAGHFVPVATIDRLYGLSMLEAGNGSPAW